MHVAAKMTSKGQITVPKVVREQLKLEPGDRVVFRVEGNRATLARTPNFLDLAGVVPVPPGKRGASWDEIRREAWRARGKRLKEQE
jgi:AbrB family looped-hinge helix DNA binding protein